MRGQVGELELLKETLPTPPAHPAGVRGVGGNNAIKHLDPSDGTQRDLAREKMEQTYGKTRQGRSEYND